MIENDPEPIHTWFELSYSNYLVVPRTLLQSMPVEWQRRFVQCLEEARERYGHLNETRYWVRAKGPDGRGFAKDPLADYERGRRRI